ncbi:hypothetical protein TcCL_ESM09000 [Trypanosoma cruzi]|nr:hypothetical protein TcCL_ESM09000 [Trypanosoma cruzi]
MYQHRRSAETRIRQIHQRVERQQQRQGGKEKQTRMQNMRRAWTWGLGHRARAAGIMCGAPNLVKTLVFNPFSGDCHKTVVSGLSSSTRVSAPQRRMGRHHSHGSGGSKGGEKVERRGVRTHAHRRHRDAVSRGKKSILQHDCCHSVKLRDSSRLLSSLRQRLGDAQSRDAPRWPTAPG